MANNYTLFSEQIDELTPAAAAWVEMVLALDPEIPEDLEKLKVELALESDDPRFFDQLDMWPYFCGELDEDKDTLWLYSEEGLKDDHLIWFVSALINKFMPDYIFRANFACTCAQPRIGEFGGYWIVVSKDHVKAGNTWDDANNATKALEPLSSEVHAQINRIDQCIDHILTDTNTEPKVLAEALRRLAASVEEGA